MLLLSFHQAALREFHHIVAFVAQFIIRGPLRVREDIRSLPIGIRTNVTVGAPHELLLVRLILEDINVLQKVDQMLGTNLLQAVLLLSFVGHGAEQLVLRGQVGHDLFLRESEAADRNRLMGDEGAGLDINNRNGGTSCCRWSMVL